MNILWGFLKDLVRLRNVIFELAKKDIKNRYLGSYLGIIWAFIQPLITILILWFIFQVGFKTQPVNNFPFVLWLIAAMIPWNFFAECLSSTSNSIQEHSYLVKKIVFRVSILPLVKILSSLFVHLFFILLIFIMYIIYGRYPTIYTIQVLYYLIATVLLVLGLSWISASLILFIKDIGQIINLLLQFGFWLTPIFWTPAMIPQKFQFFIKLNPVYYITEGYRNSFIYKQWFWEHPWETLYFWSVTLVFWIIGTLVFKRLRPHFADVL